MSLKGKTVLITRRPEQSGEMVREITRLGGVALLFPVIDIVDPESWEPVDRVIGSLDRYDAVVFVSANAAERFLGRCGSEVAKLRSRMHLAVGERTRAVVNRFGLRTRALPEEFSAEGLAAALGPDEVRGKRLLIPRGDMGREELPRHLESLGAEVATVHVYRTIRPGSADEAELRERIRGGSIDVITFASPSAVTNFAGILSAEDRAAVRRAVVAVIGPTTMEAAREAGFDVTVVSSRATGIGLIHAIDEYYG